MEKIFQALSSSTRRQILTYLSQTTLTAGEISQRFNVAKPTVSKHLDILENAGLIKSEKKGQYVHYSLVRENLVNNIFDFLADFCPVRSPLKKESKKLATRRKEKSDE